MRIGVGIGVRAVVLAAAVGLVATSSPALAAPERALADQFAPRPSSVLSAPLLSGLEPGVLLVTTTGRATTDRVASGRLWRGGAGRALGGRVARVEVAPGREGAAAAALAADPGVVAVERSRRMTSLARPNDPLYDAQWAHQLTGVETAWSTIGIGGPGTVVAVLDDGVDARHPDLRLRVKEQRTFAGGVNSLRRTGTDNRRCDSSHGTHVAGIVGAQGSDGAGVSGVLWDVSLLDYAVFTEDGAGCGASEADVVAALQAAASAGVDVVNLSLGSPGGSCSTAFQTAIDAARAAGVVVVAAAGNSQLESPGATSVPASCNGVISVGAVTSDSRVADYSSANRYVDVAAPGGNDRPSFTDGILSTVGDNGHDWLEGTSMAAPYVSGLAALLRSAEPSLTPDQVEGLIEAGAETGDGRNAAYGWGLVSAARSAQALVRGDRPRPATDPAFPIGGDGGPLQTPTPGASQVFRVDAGTGTTDPVPQAVAMSQSAFEPGTARHAVLARADVFADALAGSSLTLGLGPLLFSGPTGALPRATREELLRTLPYGSTVYLLGGDTALPATLEAELTALGFQPKRLAGVTREATAVVIARELAERRRAAGFADNGVVLLATSGNWPDAVAAGSLGAYYGLPILVTPTTTLHPATADGLRELSPTGLLVLGGPNAISDAVFADAAGWARSAPGDAVRLAGADRYGTAIKIAQFFEDALAASGVSPRCVVGANVVRADGWAHVLSASPLAGAYGCVVVPFAGAAGDSLPPATREYVRGFGIDGVLAGDVDVMTDAAAAELQALLQR